MFKIAIIHSNMYRFIPPSFTISMVHIIVFFCRTFYRNCFKIFQSWVLMASDSRVMVRQSITIYHLCYYLDTNFTRRRFGHGRPLWWPLLSLDLSCSFFFHKVIIYKTVVKLAARQSIMTASMCKMRAIFQMSANSFYDAIKHVLLLMTEILNTF